MYFKLVVPLGVIVVDSSIDTQEYHGELLEPAKLPAPALERENIQSVERIERSWIAGSAKRKEWLQRKVRVEARNRIASLITIKGALQDHSTC